MALRTLLIVAGLPAQLRKPDFLHAGGLMRYFFITVATAFCMAASAADDAPSWLTVAGDPANPAADIVEVDATSAVAFESLRKVKLRVSRAQPRVEFDGIPHQSYYSTAVVDCTGLKAWHRSVSLFDKPQWRGKMRTLEYTENDGRRLAFADMESNPTDRLIKAACAMTVQNH